MRRSKVARLLGISIAGVRQLEAKGILKSEKDEDGWHVSFDPDHVRRVAATYKPSRPTGRRPRGLVQRPVASGTVAARVFAALKAGADIQDIVIALRVPPETVRRLDAERCTNLAEGRAERKREAARSRERAEQREYDRRKAREEAMRRKHEHELKLARERDQREQETRIRVARELARLNR